MKLKSITSVVFPLTVSLANAATIAQWDFNNTTDPSFGNGSVGLIGGTSATFATGSTNDPVADNKGWNTASYPAQGTNNKTAGVEFSVSTVGYSNIAVRWDQRVSSTASKYYRLQYAPDGFTFTDLPSPVTMQVISSSSTYFEGQTNSLAGLQGVDDNPALALRVVSEFEFTATGSGTNGYVTTYGTNNYGKSGTVRFDMFTVTGTPIPGANTAPSIVGPGEQTIRVGQTTGPLNCALSDAEDPPEWLFLSAESSNPWIVPIENIEFAGTGWDRTVELRAGSEPGESVITLWVTDIGGLSTHASFLVRVLPSNTSPWISSLGTTNTLVGTPTPELGFIVGDLESAAEALEVTAESGQPELVPNSAAGLEVGGAGSNRWLRLTPVVGESGVAPITVRVTDGTNWASSEFALVVRPSPAVLLFEPFAYADGSLVTNSGKLWVNRSGTDGDCQVAQGQVELTGSRSEDVYAPLPGGPYTRDNGTVLYASFRLTCVSLPRTAPEYFAHFMGGSSLRGRISIGTSNAFDGGYHLFVANGTDTNRMLAPVLTTNIAYRIVSRYNVDAASTTLWLDPATEADVAVTALDIVSPITISSYGFRQDSGLGSGVVLVDDLRVGLTFASVTGGDDTGPGRLSIEHVGGEVVLRWSETGAELQEGALANGPFTTIAGAASPYTNTIGGEAKFFRLKR